jgi:hypothetical protein
VQHGKAVAHRFGSSCVKASRESEAYWRDAGTIDAYWEANIDLTSMLPGLDMYDHDWPIWTYAEITPPAKFVHAKRAGAASRSIRSYPADASYPAPASFARCSSRACACIRTLTSTAPCCSPTWMWDAARA